MNKTVVIFGAGAIGRGLLGDIVFCSGYKPVFVDAAVSLCERLKKTGTYNVQLGGKDQQKHVISDYEILSITDSEEILKAIEKCIFAATCVGGNNLSSIAEILVPGILARKNTLNILVCENLTKADQILAEILLKKGCQVSSFSAVPCSVERMGRTADNGIDVVVESGQSLYAGRKAWVGPEPDMPELLFCDNIEAYYKRKLYANNAGHVLLAYMGYLANCTLLYEAMMIPSIRNCLAEMLDVSAQVLVADFGFATKDIESHMEDLVRWRFNNVKLADTVKRVGRDPLRKLGPDERLVSLLRRAEKNGICTLPVSRVIAAAMHYNDAADIESVRLTQLIMEEGPGFVLQKICGFSEHERCYRECIENF